MNSTLGAVLITNLIKNAIIHNHPNGEINVIINKTSISIQNTGTEEALNEKNLFTRFGKMQPSENSTGLGLAIVKAIADLYSFNVSYSYDQKHIITVNFN